MKRNECLEECAREEQRESKKRVKPGGWESEKKENDGETKVHNN